MTKCIRCDSSGAIFYSSKGSVCFNCINAIIEECKLIEENKALKVQNETLEKDNAKLRSILCGNPTKF
jgi:hypothetical protein